MLVQPPVPRPATAPPSFHVLAKPSGPIGNLDCQYCFFLSKEALSPGDRFHGESAKNRFTLTPVRAAAAGRRSTATLGEGMASSVG